MVPQRSIAQSAITRCSLAITCVTVMGGCVPDDATISPAIEAEEYVLVGGTVIDGRGQLAIPEAIVWIKGDIIAFAGLPEDVQIPDSVEVVNVEGSFIAPGYMDLHIHLPDGNELQPVLNSLLAYGVTTVRNAATTGSDGIEVRNKIDSGKIIGPRVITAGQLIDGPNSVHRNAIEVQSLEATAAAVRKQASQGVDYIKVYTGLSDSLVQVAIDEAHQHNLKVLGHLRSTTWTNAAGMGIDGLTHSGTSGPMWELIPEFLYPSPGQPGSVEDWLELFDLSHPLMDTLAMAVLQHGIEINPTLSLTWAMIYGAEPDSIRRFDVSAGPPELATQWTGKPHPFSRFLPVLTEQQKDQLYDSFASIILKLSDYGSLVTTGTDLTLPWMTPGVAEHVEMQLLVEAGFTPLEALRAATINGAEALGMDGHVGEIETGFRADLVILSKNPLDDISNSRTIDLVITNGVAYRPQDLLDSFSYGN